ncbi:MAG: hypothetical protein KatS3mg002_0425 [Candidatus Woesearchaeota archaeon]|nr:MAG: hypothetical protein KatS3mg002_0425 [Candidatus Woesearchaeota archaeon]
MKETIESILKNQKYVYLDEKENYIEDEIFSSFSKDMKYFYKIDYNYDKDHIEYKKYIISDKLTLFRLMCCLHDWDYDKSDDYNEYVKGQRQRKRIMSCLDMSKNKEELLKYLKLYL